MGKLKDFFWTMVMLLTGGWTALWWHDVDHTATLWASVVAVIAYMVVDVIIEIKKRKH